MKKIIAELRQIIAVYQPMLKKLNDESISVKPAPDKWSGKEILGHLIDSAQNNIRRFVVAQYENKPVIIYKQDDWVRISAYQQYAQPELIELWRLLNLHICRILENISPDISQRLCQTNDPEPHTIEWLAGDYNKHLLHHLHQVLHLEPVPYP